MEIQYPPGLNSDQRRRYRKRIEREVVTAKRMAALREAFASCGTCRHFRDVSTPRRTRTLCDLQSDGEGQVRVGAGDICTSHAAKREG